MKAKVITFINEKGGIGKTSTCFNTAWELAKDNRVLLIDLDGQRANLTYFCGVKKEEEMETIFDVLCRSKAVQDTIIEVKENLYIIPATVEVSNLTQTAKVSKFKKAIQSINSDYDYIFIDVSPSPNWGQYLALSASDYAIIPMLPDIASIEASNGIVESLEEILDTSNSNLKVLGILFNKYDTRTNLSKQVTRIANKLAEKLDTKIFDTKIRNSVSLSENVYVHKGITEYDKKSMAANDYINLIEEIKKELKDHE